MHEIIYATVAAIVTGLVTWLTTHRHHTKGRTDVAFKFAMQQCTALQTRVDQLEHSKQELSNIVLNQSRQLDDLARRLNEEYDPAHAIYSSYRHLPFPVWITNTTGHVLFVNLCFEHQWQTNLLRVQLQQGLSIWPDEVADIFESQQQQVLSKLQASRTIVAIPTVLDQPISELNPLEQWEVTMACIASIPE